MVVKLWDPMAHDGMGLRVVLSHMVVKLVILVEQNRYRFESSVISYGSQTGYFAVQEANTFESSVISYGSQTQQLFITNLPKFESSVISYGSQTL